MKTMDIVKISKGYYLTTRYGGQAQAREFFKNKKDLEARQKALKTLGYVLSV